MNYKETIELSEKEFEECVQTPLATNDIEVNNKDLIGKEIFIHDGIPSYDFCSEELKKNNISFSFATFGEYIDYSKNLQDDNVKIENLISLNDSHDIPDLDKDIIFQVENNIHEVTENRINKDGTLSKNMKESSKEFKLSINNYSSKDFAKECTNTHEDELEPRVYMKDNKLLRECDIVNRVPRESRIDKINREVEESKKNIIFKLKNGRKIPNKFAKKIISENPVGFF